MIKYLLFTSMLTWSLQVTAQVSGNFNYGHKTIKDNNTADATIDEQKISISVKGLMNATADEYVAFFHVIQVGEDVRNTNKHMNQRISKFKAALASTSIDTTNAVHVDLISFVPQYTHNVFNKLFSPSFNEIPDAFEMQKNISIRYHKSSMLDAIVTAAASAEIYDLVKVDYFLSDIKKNYNELRHACHETLKSRVVLYQPLGLKLDTLRKTFAEDFVTVLPQNRYGSYQAIARPSAKAMGRSSGGSDKISLSDDHSKSVYYQAVSYEEFDLVINPTVDQPVVQLTYEITVQYVLPDNEIKVPNNLIFLGNAGQLQRIEVPN
jgi:uncharacterized protein YggE